MLKLSDLALRPDLQLGPMLVSPSRRLVEGPGGHAHVEPLIMQVFLLLIDAGGKVVTRNELFDQCWGGVIVGDDSLNRAIAKVRRTGAHVAPGLFEIETIPRTGYRLTGEILRHLGKGSPIESGEATAKGWMSRRKIIGAGVAATALGGVGLWWLTKDPKDPRVARLIAEGKRRLVDNWPGTERRAIDTLRRAIDLDPENAEAWGLLAYAEAQDIERQSERQAEPAQVAARTALAIDSREPNALLAMLSLQRGMLAWASREDEFRRILAIGPDNVLVLRTFSQFLHGAGRVRDAYRMRERAVVLAPLSPDLQARRAMSLWALGRSAESDRVIDRAMELWPSHRLVRMARLMIYAFTARTPAARAMVEDEELAPHLLSSAAASVWRASLNALEQRTPSTIAAARQANLEGAATTPATAAYAILILSALGDLDAAFDVTNGFLLARGSIILRQKAAPNAPFVNNLGWRNTFGLFMPPTKPMRLDRRFGPLCEELGLRDYWATRRNGPDAFLFKS